MAKVKKQKYYAIKKARDITDTILTSWLECEPLVKGCIQCIRALIPERVQNIT